VEALGINATGLIAQLINFLLLLALLRVVAYRPILNLLDQRAARIRESMERAEQINREAARMEEEFKQRLEQARREAQAIIANATQAAERLRQEAQERAQREAEAFLARAREQIERDRERALAELRAYVADLAILAASKVIERSLDRSAHADLIDRVLAETPRLGRG
jgi:F-type H+-transporting ATPase subunit b